MLQMSQAPAKTRDRLRPVAVQVEGRATRLRAMLMGETKPAMSRLEADIAATKAGRLPAFLRRHMSPEEAEGRQFGAPSGDDG